jgi:hypothetical protein
MGWSALIGLACVCENLIVAFPHDNNIILLHNNEAHSRFRVFQYHQRSELCPSLHHQDTNSMSVWFVELANPE